MERQKAKYIELLKHIENVDDIILENFQYIQWNYHKTNKKYRPLAYALMIFYILVSLVYIYSLTHCYCDYITSFFIAITYGLITVIPSHFSVLHVSKMDLIRLRFRLISQLLDQQITDIQDHNHNHNHNQKKFFI